MKKGFTLIELLAVIVILAVIAIIATPKILSIIDDVKERAMISSATIYVDGLTKKIASANLINEFNPSSCTITDENMTCDGVALDYRVNGEKPTSGTITLNNGTVTGYELLFSDYAVIKNSNETTLVDGQLYRDMHTVGILTYDANGHGEVPSPVTMTYSDTVYAEVLFGDVTGYKFSKWCTNSDGTGSCYAAASIIKGADKVPSDMTLYAIWNEKAAMLTYNKNGKTTQTFPSPASVTMRYSQAYSVTSTKPTATGYKFSKWCTKSNGTGSCYNTNATLKAANVIPTTTTLYAQWVANTYTVTLNANDGTSYSKNIGLTYYSTNNNTVTIPVPSGMGYTHYTFDGYWTAATGGTKVYSATGSWNSTAAAYWTSSGQWKWPQNVVLYAHWKR